MPSPIVFSFVLLASVAHRGDRPRRAERADRHSRRQSPSPSPSPSPSVQQLASSRRQSSNPAHDELMAGIRRPLANHDVVEGCFPRGHDIRTRRNPLRRWPDDNVQLCGQNHRCKGFQIYVLPNSTAQDVWIEVRATFRAREHARERICHPLDLTAFPACTLVALIASAVQGRLPAPAALPVRGPAKPAGGRRVVRVPCDSTLPALARCLRREPRPQPAGNRLTGASGATGHPLRRIRRHRVGCARGHGARAHAPRRRAQARGGAEASQGGGLSARASIISHRLTALLPVVVESSTLVSVVVSGADIRQSDSDKVVSTQSRSSTSSRLDDRMNSSLRHRLDRATGPSE